MLVKQGFKAPVMPAAKVESVQADIIHSREDLLELVDDARRLGIEVKEIPRQVARRDSSLAKLADEYNWVTITKKIEPPTPARLADWARWSRLLDPKASLRSIPPPCRISRRVRPQ
jgi:hypothetical protein